MTMSNDDQKYYSSSWCIGETSRGISRGVFFDTHTSVLNNGPGVTLITGKPGSGKTFLAQHLSAFDCLAGKIVVMLDPKGDFSSFAYLQDDLGDMSFWDLERGAAGLLDPFFMSDQPTEQLTLCINVIDIFVGGLGRDDIAILSPVIRDVIDDRNPSLLKVVDSLKRSDKPHARNLGAELELIRQLKFARLCFAPGKTRRAAVSLKEGVNIINLHGLALPRTSNPTDRDERLSSGVFYLLVDYIRRLMYEDTSKKPKTIVIDEAHSILSSDKGVEIVRSIALKGRSLQCSILLITQSTTHLEGLQIENTVSSHFAFATDRKDATAIVKSMEAPLNEGLEDVLVNLNKGECLMKDWRGRHGFVNVIGWDGRWREAFATNPLEKKRSS